MNYKVLALMIMVFSFGGLLFVNQYQITTGTINDSSTSKTDSQGITRSNITVNNNPIVPPRFLTKINTSQIAFINATSPFTNGPNSEYNASGSIVSNTDPYPVFKFNLQKDYYLNLTMFYANWYGYNNTNGNITTYTLDIDFTVFFGNSTDGGPYYPWVNGTSSVMNETITAKIPETGLYYLVAYPSLNDFRPWGSYINTTLLDNVTNTYNTTFYGGTPNILPHLNMIRLQMVDAGYALYSNNLDLTTANNTDILPHLPTLRSGQTTWLWEHDKFGLPTNELYKLDIPANTTVYITVTYGTNGITGLSANSQVLTLINYNDYVSYLHGTFTGSYSKVGTNAIVGVAGPHLVNSSIYNYVPSTSADSYYIISLDSPNFNIGTDFNYTINITMKDFIDANYENNSLNSAYDISNSSSLTLFTNTSDDDYFVIKPSSTPLRLTVNVYFDRSYGNINLYVYNSSTVGNFVLTSLLAKSDSPDLSQQTVNLELSDQNPIYLKINSTALYSNEYQLNFTLGTLDDSYEPNNNLLQPATLTKPGTYDLYLTKSDSDFFRIFLFQGDKLNVTITFDGSMANLNLFMANDQLQIIGTSAKPSGNNESLETTATDNGYVYFSITSPVTSFLPNAPGVDYKLILTVIARDDYLEPNDNKNQAVPIQDGLFQLISRAGNEDWFDIYMRAGDKLTVDVTFDTSKADIDIFLYDKAVSNIFNSSQTFTNNESLSLTALYEGDYLLRVALFDGLSANYTMNITLTDQRYDKWEDNDNFQQAKTIGQGLTTGIVAQGGDHDFFKVSVPTGYAIIVELKEETPGSAKNFALILYSAQEVEINRSERNLNSQYIYPIPVKSSTFFYIDAHYKGFGKVTYSLNITLGLNSVLFPTPKLSLATNIPIFSFNTYSSSTTTTSGAHLFNIGTLLVIGAIGIGGGAAAGVGGTIISQKTSLGTKIKKRIFKK